MAICRKCEKDQFQIGGYLQRVNELGVDGIFECRSNCDVEMSDDEAILAAIEGEDELL